MSFLKLKRKYVTIQTRKENNNKFLGANKLECVIKEFDIYNQSYIIDSLILFSVNTGFSRQDLMGTKREQS